MLSCRESSFLVGKLRSLSHKFVVSSSCARSSWKLLGRSFPLAEPPFTSEEQDVDMEPSADKRSRESPDSTLKPEGKSLKTSGVAVATEGEPAMSNLGVSAPVAADHNSPEAPIICWNVKEESEVKQTMWRLHRSLPAWKLKVCRCHEGYTY